MASILLAKAVILSVDSATVSGAALSVPELVGSRVRDYEVLQFGLVKTQADRRSWAQFAAEAAAEEKLPLLVAAERWSRHGLSALAFESLCEHWGMWRAALEEEAPGALVIRALPEVWRDAVFGKQRARGRDDLKKQAVRYVELALGLPMLQEDVAEALCIRVWAGRAEQAHALLSPRSKPKQRRLLRSGKVVK